MVTSCIDQYLNRFNFIFRLLAGKAQQLVAKALWFSDKRRV
ncbi:hypothetical protein [Vibrio vulnificus YJ016]|uniref:Uncharacterized protein n=1 Tax=Vibrio vulnificus (strain YJ016) TaxID=196600 RepID=Q7MPX9_VIBVY|nr:hypothetical protein [Vibrio vulnificus YJ016]